MNEILCHCGGDEGGHELAECGTKLTTRRVGVWPEIPRLGEYEHVNLAKLDARGTCPVCHRPGLRVRRVEVYRDFEGERRAGRYLPPVTNPAKPRGTPLEIRPGMAPHEIKGVECAGSGQVPAETRYTPGRELAGYLQLLAEEEKSA